MKPGKLTPAEAEAIALRRNQRTPGTVEVSEADYRRLVDERRALITALKGAADYIECCADESDDPAGAHTYAQNIRAALKLAEEGD